MIAGPRRSDIGDIDPLIEGRTVLTDGHGERHHFWRASSESRHRTVMEPGAASCRAPGSSGVSTYRAANGISTR